MNNEDLLKCAIGGVVKDIAKRSTKIKDLEIGGGKKGTRSISFDEIEGSNKRQKRKRWGDDEIEKWTGYDFTCLLHECYISKTGSDWNLNWLPVNNSVLRIKDRLLDLFGLCDNILLRDYIYFFFRNYFDDYMRRKGDFYVSFLEDYKVLNDFFKSYDYSGKPQHSVRKQDVDNKETLSNESLEAAFLLSDSIFLSKFGFILAVNWLILKRGFSHEEAINFVTGACRRSKKVKEIIKATKSFEPYPKWFPFRQIKMLLGALGISYPVNIRFITNNDKFDYLRNIE